MSSLVPPGKFRNRNSNYAPSTSFHMPSTLSHTLNFRVPRRIIWAADNFVQCTTDYCYSWNSRNPVGTETMLQARGFGVWNPVEARDFTFTPAVGPSQPSIPRVERTERELKHPSPSRGEFKNERNYNCTELYVCFHGVDRENCNFFIITIICNVAFCFGCYWFLSSSFQLQKNLTKVFYSPTNVQVIVLKQY
jgi:hypothetical protein